MKEEEKEQQMEQREAKRYTVELVSWKGGWLVEKRFNCSILLELRHHLTNLSSNKYK